MKIFTIKNLLFFATVAEAQTTERSATEASGWVTTPKVENQEEGLEARGSGKVEARRYGDLKNIAEVIFTHPGHNKMDQFEFNTFWSRLWSYGCHCFSADSDRPMSEMGFGIPVDGVDSACRAYKRCQRCVSQQYNGTTPIGECIGEFVRYRWVEGMDGYPAYAGQGNTCEEGLFQCDYNFAMDLFDEPPLDPRFSKVDSIYGWDRFAYGNCKRPERNDVPYRHECCHTGGNWQWYNVHTKKCCHGVKVARIDDTCNHHPRSK